MFILLPADVTIIKTVSLTRSAAV